MRHSESHRAADFWKTLFDFEARPGRYALVLREPRILFDGAKRLLQLCAGRVSGEMAVLGIEEHAARRAARFFVRTAMLRQGVDHFTLMGLRPGFEDAELKEHYRLLMRLTHPDFSNAQDGWPADAATRINLAHGVLSSPDQRFVYEQTIEPQAFRTSPSQEEEGDVVRRNGRWQTSIQTFVLGGLASAAVWAAVVAVDRWRTQEVHGGPVVAVSVPPVIQSPAVAVASAAPVVVDSLPAASAAVQVAVVEPIATVPTPITEPVPPAGRRSSERPPGVKRQEPRAAGSERAVVAPDGGQPLVVAQPRQEVAPTVPTPVALVPASAAQTGAQEGTTVPRLADVQPHLSGLISAMLSGKSQSLLAAIDPPVRASAGATRLVQTYAEAVKGAEEVKMGSLQLRSRVESGQLVVEGAVHFVLLDQGRTPAIRELRLRAQYVQRGHDVVLTGIAPAQP